eukprot:Gb_15585 [translate_table: standard]
MGGDPVMTEPTVLKMEEDMKALLEKAGPLDFFQNFTGFSESISLQVVNTWDEGRVKVDDLDFIISEHLISKVLGLPMEGEVVCNEKMNQVEQLSKFIRDDETFCWLQSGIARESLLKPWDRVAIQVMKYLTLEGKYRKLFGYHIAILNSIRNNVKINVSLFLLKSVEKSIKSVKSSKGKLPLHQGLLNLLFQFEKAESGLVVLPLKGNPLRDSEVVKDSTKISYDAQNVIKELKSQLKILNGLGGSLTSTYAYINILALEITNYLKEVVSRLKELNPNRP